MKRVGLYILGISMSFFGCKKSSDSALQGAWKLVKIENNNTGVVTTQPAGTPGEVVLVFTGTRFSGHTLKNTFGGGTYTLQNGTDITFGNYSMTKVLEDEWGGMFLTMLNSCFLQSVAPCTPSKITSIGNNSIVIRAFNSQDYTFIRQ